MLKKIKRYLPIAIPFLLLFLFNKEKPKETPKIVNKAEVMIKNAHLYSNIVDGKKIELFAKEGQHKNNTILISGVEGIVTDANDITILKIKTPSGEFNMKNKIIKIQKAIEIEAYENINRNIKITSKDIEFNTGKRMINFKSDLSMGNEKFSVVAKSGEYDINSMSIKLKNLTIKQK